MAESGTHRYRTVEAAAREIGLPLRILEAWVADGLVSMHPNPNAAQSGEQLVDTTEIKALMERKRREAQEGN